MKFQKKILATAIAAVGLGGSMAANAIALSPSGVGEALLVPYYSTVDGNKTFLTITNTDGNAKAVKVRFREGVGSRDVFDFTLYLSEYDVWSALVYKDGDRVTVATQDTSCTVPDVGVGKGSFSDTRIPLNYQGSVIDRLSEGHIEILEMAVLDGKADDIYKAITHVDGVPADCALARKWTAEMAQKTGNHGLDAILVGLTSATGTTDSATETLYPPSGGMYAHAAVFNPTDGTYFTYEADALVGWGEGVLWFPQNSTGVEALWRYTTDQGLAWDEGLDDSGFVEYFDLPDLSTPAVMPSEHDQMYIATVVHVSSGAAVDKLALVTQTFTGSIDTGLTTNTGTGQTKEKVDLALGSEAAAAKRDAVTSALLKYGLANDYITGGGYATEWLVTFPSRYLHVNAEGGVDASDKDLPPWALASDPFTTYEKARTGEACEEIDFKYWDREEGTPSDPGSIDFSPGGSTPDKFQLCYEVNVMAFNQDAAANSGVLRSATVAKYVGLETGYNNGWAVLDFSDFSIKNWDGLPSTGFMAIADISGDVARGATFRHHQDAQVD